MADETRHESITEAVTKTIARHIEDNVERVRQTLLDFPDHNDRLRMPSVSIFASSPEFSPKMNPYKRSSIKNSDINNHKASVDWVVGDYDFKLQLDLWCGSKEELDDVVDDIFNALNPELNPMGVRLEMDEYHGVVCDYLYVGHTRGSTAERSQRDEWRMSLEVLATCKAVRSRKQFVIESTKLELDVATDIIAADE